MRYIGRRFGDVENGFVCNGIIATFEKNKDVMLTGFCNQIKHVGYVFCNDENGIDRAMEVLKECGYNYCRKESATCIKVMYDTDMDDWGIKVYC